MAENSIREFLERGLHPVWLRLYADQLDEIQRAFRRWSRATDEAENAAAQARCQHLQRLVDFLMHWIRERLGTLDDLQGRFTEFRQHYARAVTRDERREYILDFAQAMGATPRQLRGDRRAFARWFGDDAITERYLKRRAESEREIAFVLGRLGVLCSLLIETAGQAEDAARTWRRTGLEKLIRPLLSYPGDARIRTESFRCLASALQALPRAAQETSVTDATLKYIYRSALERHPDVWLQCQALGLLKSLSPQSLDTALHKRLRQPGSGDDLFVRRYAVRLLGDRLIENPELAALVEAVVDDPSPAVRQVLPGALISAPEQLVKRILPQLLSRDAEPAVRASALLVIPDLLRRDTLLADSLQSLMAVLRSEQNTFVLRVALQVVTQGHIRLERQPEGVQTWDRQILPVLNDLHQNAESLSVRRWVASTREQLWVATSPRARTLKAGLGEFARAVPSGGTATVRRRMIREYDAETVGRTLAVLAQEDFGFDLQRHGLLSRLTRGHRFGFRLWRLIHEVRHPSTDKRQAFRHTVGRVFRGTLRAPSGILSELAQTKVPGEPLFMGSEAGWRPYLPLVDEVISSLDQPFRAGPLNVYTSEGITEILPPRSVVQRLRARLRLTNDFARYAELRNWREGGPGKPDDYVRALQALGFQVRLRPHRALTGELWTADPAVVRFFPGLLPFSGPDITERIQDYFFSVYENSLEDLSLFLACMMSWFIGRHLYLSTVIRRARRSIPLVIGGWGTRGKSGTERIKAALFNALGHSVVSKTTGCEAMFLHAHPNGKLREMFLFRPYDKATIWEQANVLRISRQLDTHVFLWECMGLTPAYVGILQQQWVRDDLSTITNTYPDHEDLQGPAGINIPQVMTNFIPHNATLITSEEQMAPILREAAAQRDTGFHTTGWLEAGLLTPDVVARFPYAEHPYNIALVLKMAEALDVDQDFALKEMADRVVPDLGVLKASPPAPVRGRVLEFVNGMSANERFGCLGNFDRMGFTDQDPYQDPAVWLTTVVNNRADRVSRSRVFSSILVKDISVDRNFLIGTNLDGLRNYIREDWTSHVESVSLWSESGTAAPAEVLEQTARRMRIPFCEAHLTGRLRAMLQGLGITEELDALSELWSAPDALQKQLQKYAPEKPVEALKTHIADLARSYGEYREFAEDVASAGQSVDPDLDNAFRRLLWTWFERKLVVIEDPHTSGNQIIDRITRETPPGLHNRIMGMQNIKGTGLDFVYRWQAWETCYQACQELRGKTRDLAERGLRTLSTFQEYGVLCEETVRATVEEVRHSQTAQNELFQGELTVILSHLENAMQQVNRQLGMTSESGAGALTRLLACTEAFLDSGDAVKRRKKANRIYQDLSNERISHERAALELQALNKRQKGGWLQRRVEDMLAVLRPGRQ